MNLSLLKTLKFIIQHPLNRKRKAHAILNFVKWQFGSRLVPGDVIYPWIDNTKFIVSSGEHGLTQNIYCGLHEFNDMAYVLHVVDNEDLFIDIGANVGSYTILACGAKGARGICFEPVPQTYSRLKENLILNGLLDRVRAHNVGLADEEGELFFTSNQNTTNHILLGDVKPLDAITVKVMPLDAMLEEKMPSLIKIDVEGFETLVIAGASQTLQKPSLHSVIMEFNGSGEKYGFDEEELMQTMYSFGFQMLSYDPFRRKIGPVSGENWRTGNIIFGRDERYLQSRIDHASPIHVNGFDL